MKQDLKKLGLSYNETQVYLSLLKLGQTPVGGIIEDIKTHRQIVYNNLQSLEEKGLVEKIVKNNVRHYKVADPKILMENVTKQALVAKRLIKSISNEMKKSRHQNEINTYEGKGKIQRLFLDKHLSLPTGSKLYGLSLSLKNALELLGEDYTKKIYKLREKRKITTKVLIDKKESTDFEKLKKETNASLPQIRCLPYSVSIATFIWPDSVTLQSLHAKDPFVIEIKNKEFQISQLKHFQMLWKIAKK